MRHLSLVAAINAHTHECIATEFQNMPFSLLHGSPIKYLTAFMVLIYKLSTHKSHLAIKVLSLCSIYLPLL